MARIDLKVTPLYHRIEGVDARIIFLRGGARSSKSYTITQKIVLWLYTGWIDGDYVPEGLFSIIRLTMPALKATVYRDFIEILHQLGIYHFVNHMKTTSEFSLGRRTVSFFPCDSEQKLRGRKHTFAFLEEVNDIPYDVFHQVNMRTERKIWMSVNPSGHPWARTEIEDKMTERGNVHVDVSTYHDNPFLNDSIKAEIESLKYTDESLYRIYALGEWTELKGLIFPVVNIVKTVPYSNRVFYGLDIGYNDPSVLVKVTIIENDLYIETLIYENKMLLDRMASEILKLNIIDRIYADASEPRTILELKQRGVYIKAAKKGPDSIKQGLNFIKQHRIHVHENSLKSIDEFRRYKWAEDSDGNMLDKPIDQYNHTADAARYAISRALKTRLKLIA